MAETAERVAIASVPNVHWMNGAVVDLQRVALALREAESAFVIDASQSLGAMPLDVAALRPNALVAVGYKWLLGPFSLGDRRPGPGVGPDRPSPGRARPHMLGLELPPKATPQAAAALAESKVIASVRGSSLRISPHLHNNQEDIDRLLDAKRRRRATGRPGSRRGRLQSPRSVRRGLYGVTSLMQRDG